MNITLGPRQLFVESGGKTEPVSVLINFEEPRQVDLGDEVFVEECVGVVHIESADFSKRMVATGDDELQVVFHLLRLADVYLARTCVDMSLRLLRNENDPVEDGLGAFE